MTKRATMDDRVTKMMATLEAACCRLGLLGGDFGKAINRIRVKGYEADLSNLKLTVSAEASGEEELVVMAFDAFKRAQQIAHRDDCVTGMYMYGDYEGDSDKTDAPVAEMKRAVDQLSDKRKKC